MGEPDPKQCKAELEALKQENQTLNEQVKQLVKAERRASLSQQRLDRQLQRVEILNRFSLAARRTEEALRIFSLAMDALFEVFAFEQGIAFRVKEGAVTERLARAVQGREARRSGPIPNPGNPPIRAADIPSNPAIGSIDDVRERAAPLAPLLDEMERQFADTESAVPEVLAMPIYVKETTELQGVLLLRRTPRSLSFFDQLPTQEDLPFLRLVQAHVTQAFENARLYREAQRAIRMRDEFVSIASHELRTPITPLKSEMQLIKMLVEQDRLATYPKAQLHKLVVIADRELVRLTRLIDSMLDVTRITSGKFTLKLEQIRIGELITEMVERLRYQLGPGGLIHLDLRDTEPAYWDRIRMEQVITNLITNAIRYGAGKPITIQSSTSPSNTPPGHARISIRDEGIGMTKEHQSRLFQKYETVFSTRTFGGLGLGLFISRQIVEAHHGKISVQSAPGVGTEFTVELPLDAAREAAA